MVEPNWECVDMFGDKLTVTVAGEDLVLAIQRKADPVDYDHACVSLSPQHQHELRRVLVNASFAGVHERTDADRYLDHQT